MKLSVRECSITALMAALLCVLSLISFPIGAIPVTLQTFAVALCGAMLGPKLGALSTVVYLLIGGIGLPVFSGFSAGFGRFVGPTGGFLTAFPAMAALCGLFRSKSVYMQFATALAGLAVLYLMGAAQFALVARLSFWDAAKVGILPFMIKDVIGVASAVLVFRGYLIRNSQLVPTTLNRNIRNQERG